MPEISRFFGIIIRMFAEAGAPHQAPHLHAYYQDGVAVFGIDPIELIAGSIPQKRGDSSRRGPSFIRKNSGRIGNFSRPDGGRARSNPSNEDMDMTHPIYRVVAFEVLGERSLRVTFDDGVARVIDFTPVLAGELFGPLRDPGLFRQVRIDPEVHTLVWPNGADFDPATLHDWPEHVAALEQLARRWESRAA